MTGSVISTEKITMPYNKLLTNLTCSGPYWGILVLSRSCTDLAVLGPYCHDLGEIFIPNRTFWYASEAYQASLVEPRYPRRDQTSLICCRSVPKKERLGIYRTQIRPKTRFFFSYTRAPASVTASTFGA